MGLSFIIRTGKEVERAEKDRGIGIEPQPSVLNKIEGDGIDVLFGELECSIECRPHIVRI